MATWTPKKKYFVRKDSDRLSHTMSCHMGVNPKIGEVFPPKWMVFNGSKPYKNGMIWVVFPYFWVDTHMCPTHFPWIWGGKHPPTPIFQHKIAT